MGLGGCRSVLLFALKIYWCLEHCFLFPGETPWVSFFQKKKNLLAISGVPLVNKKKSQTNGSPADDFFVWLIMVIMLG